MGIVSIGFIVFFLLTFLVLPQIDLSLGQTIKVTIAAESNLTLSVVILRHNVPLHEIV